METLRGVDWLIDGYNLMPRWRQRVGGAAGKLAAERDALLHWLATRLPEPARATVAFDARDDSRTGLRRGAAEWSAFRGVRIVYAVGYRDADALLAELCEQHAAPRTLRVVSDDRAVRDVARRSGAGWVACGAFLGLLAGDAPRGAPASKPAAPPHAPPAEEDRQRRPTAAEAAEWLRVFGGAPALEPEQPPEPPKAPSPVLAPPKPPVPDADLDDFRRAMRQAEADGFPDDPPPRRKR